MSKVFLDYAAATPLSDEALKAMQPFFQEKFYNPSATYLDGRSTKNELNRLRAQAANVLGARPAEIIFTSGATEANNLAIKGVTNALGGKVVISAVEHDSVLQPAKSCNAVVAPVAPNGQIDLAWLASNLDGVGLVSIMLINNEVGTVQPIREIAEIVKNERLNRLKKGDKTPIYLHTDAAQAGLYLDLHVSRLGVDLMSVNGGKIFGPKGSGLLFVKAGTNIKPQAEGGGQEYGLRSGTENLAAAAGLISALSAAQSKREIASQVKELRHHLESKILNIYPEAVINGGKKRAPHISSISFVGQDNERLMMQLDEAGIACGLGSACSASSQEPSHVLTALGINLETARSSLRFSLSPKTMIEEIDFVLKVLEELFS